MTQHDQLGAVVASADAYCMRIFSWKKLLSKSRISRIWLPRAVDSKSTHTYEAGKPFLWGTFLAEVTLMYFYGSDLIGALMMHGQ